MNTTTVTLPHKTIGLLTLPAHLYWRLQVKLFWWCWSFYGRKRGALVGPCHYRRWTVVRVLNSWPRWLSCSSAPRRWIWRLKIFTRAHGACWFGTPASTLTVRGRRLPNVWLR